MTATNRGGAGHPGLERSRVDRRRARRGAARRGRPGLVVVSSPTDPTAAVARAHGARVWSSAQPGYGAACWAGAETALAEGAADRRLPRRRLRRPARRATARARAAARRVAPTWCSAAATCAVFPTPCRRTLGSAIGWCCACCACCSARASATCRRSKPSAPTPCASMDMREMTYGWTVEMLVKAARARPARRGGDDRVPAATGRPIESRRQPARIDPRGGQIARLRRGVRLHLAAR